MRNKTERIQTLKNLAILDTAPEVVYNDLARAAAHTFGVPIAMVNLLDADRDWFKACVGLPLTESPAETSFCAIFFASSEDIIVAEDTTLDERFASHPLVVGPPHIRFYGAARLVVDGQLVGTLCVYDTQPQKVTAEQIDQLRLLGDAAMSALARRKP